MKCSESWLREWVAPSLSRDEISHLLTMSGFEVEELTPVTSNAPAEDYVFDIAITPNRGDCLSMQGMAREVAALTKSSLKIPAIPSVIPTTNRVQALSVQANESCPHYVGRIISHIKPDVSTPAWLCERLQHSGIRSINPVVDVTNYVMLEIGQPMHAFDLEKIQQTIIVRQAKQGERIALLDGSETQLDAQTLVVADENQPLAIAGVMGGIDSGVTSLTKDIFLESAFFDPKVVARQRQHYGLTSESAYRFERGVDATLQRQAIERATELILTITGGEAGPVIEETHQEFLPTRPTISLSSDKITRVLGIEVSDQEVEAILSSLGLEIRNTISSISSMLSKHARKKSKGQSTTWTVLVPSYRYDLSLPEDVIEEIARLYGYDNIPTHALKAELAVEHAEEGEARDLLPLQQLLSDLGYHDIISYSFIDKALQKILDPEVTARELVNPITTDMTVMRTNLWPGLIKALVYNLSRQQQRVRLSEIGTCFMDGLQRPQLAGLAMGTAFPEQWGRPMREVDFFDLKGDIERILKHFLLENDIVFKPASHPALHPGRTARLDYNGKPLGIMGALHPNVLQSLGLEVPVYVFQLDLDLLTATRSALLSEVSKFPEIRRDLAILVNQAIPTSEIQDTIKWVAGDWLKDVFIFDVYQGKGISPGLKSIAFALLFQHPTRTLVDDEVVALMERIITTLKGTFEAELRR